MDTINGLPVVLSQHFPKRPGTLAGRHVLLNRGDGFVVATQIREGETWREGWHQGDYVTQRDTNGLHRDTLSRALELYDRRCRKDADAGAVDAGTFRVRLHVLGSGDLWVYGKDRQTACREACEMVRVIGATGCTVTGFYTQGLWSQGWFDDDEEDPTGPSYWDDLSDAVHDVKKAHNVA